MWTELGHAQLEAGSVAEAIASYIKSGHTGRYIDVIARSRDSGAHTELVKFLLMVRKKIKEPKVRPEPPGEAVCAPWWGCPLAHH